MSNDKLVIHNKYVLNELAFMTAGRFYGDNAQKMLDRLMYLGLDENSLGFWVYDLQENIELYSPMFRAVLQYDGKTDFPDSPESWQKAIDKDDLPRVLALFGEHLESNGEMPYIQKVRYYKKYKGYLDVICHGKIVSWKDEKPKLMVGVHLEPL